MVVTLYTQKQFFNITEAPSWAGGLNDGKLRIPIQGVTSMTPELHCCRSRRLSRARACPDRSRRGARATKKRMTEAAKIYCVAGVAHTLRIFRFRDSSRARLSSLMRPMSLLESCSLEANSQRTRHFSGSCLSFIGRPLLKWQDQVRSMTMARFVPSGGLDGGVRTGRASAI